MVMTIIVMLVVTVMIMIMTTVMLRLGVVKLDCICDVNGDRHRHDVSAFLMLLIIIPPLAYLLKPAAWRPRERWWWLACRHICGMSDKVSYRSLWLRVRTDSSCRRHRTSRSESSSFLALAVVQAAPCLPVLRFSSACFARRTSDKEFYHSKFSTLLCCSCMSSYSCMCHCSCCCACRW